MQTMRLQITVTQADIKACKDGKFKGGHYNCPIELAAQRVLKQKVMGIGCDALMSLRDGAIYSLPREARGFAEAYAAGSRVEPLVFAMGHLGLLTRLRWSLERLLSASPA